MKVNEENLFKSGYKYYKDEHNYMCDRFYQKSLSKEDEKTKCINVYYYDRFKNIGALDYDFEWELVEEKENRWEKKMLYCINKDMSIEEIEGELLK